MQWLTHVCRIIINYARNNIYNNLYSRISYLKSDQRIYRKNYEQFNFKRVENCGFLRNQEFSFRLVNFWSILVKILQSQKVVFDPEKTESKRKNLKIFKIYSKTQKLGLGNTNLGLI